MLHWMIHDRFIRSDRGWSLFLELLSSSRKARSEYAVEACDLVQFHITPRRAAFETAIGKDSREGCVEDRAKEINNGMS